MTRRAPRRRTDSRRPPRRAAPVAPGPTPRRRGPPRAPATPPAVSGSSTMLVCSGSLAPHGRASRSSGRAKPSRRSGCHGAGPQVLDELELARPGPVDVLVDDQRRSLITEALDRSAKREEQEPLLDDRRIGGETEEQPEVARRLLSSGRGKRGEALFELLSSDVLCGSSRRSRTPGGRAVRTRDTRSSLRRAGSGPGHADRRPPRLRLRLPARAATSRSRAVRRRSRRGVCGRASHGV